MRVSAPPAFLLPRADILPACAFSLAKFPVECVYFSNSYSQCKPCNAAWEQCGGLVPGTSTPWTAAARPGCCAKGSMCKYVSSSFYQCQPV